MTTSLFTDIDAISTSKEAVNRTLHHKQVKDKLKIIFNLEAEKGYAEGKQKGYDEGYQAGKEQARIELENAKAELGAIANKYNDIFSKPCEFFDELTNESIVVAFGNILEAIFPTLLAADNSLWKSHLLDAVQLIPANSAVKTVHVHPDNFALTQELFKDRPLLKCSEDCSQSPTSFKVSFDEHTINYDSQDAVEQLLTSLRGT